MSHSRRFGTFILAAITAGLFAVPGVAQNATGQAAPEAANNDTTSMTIAATVRDKHGNLVPGLTKSDFTLVVDGKPQTIESVGSATGMPLTVGLLEQTNLGQPDAIDSESKGSKSFLDTMLKAPDAKAFVIQFDREVDLLADVSSNKAKLDAALGQLGSPQSHDTAADNGGASGDHRVGGSGTTLYDAIYLASSEVIAKQPGRKVLILVTDGVDRGSKVSMFRAVEAAQRANAAVYAIYVKDNQGKGNNGQSPERHRRVGMGYPGGGNPGGGNPGGGYPGTGSGWPGGGGRGNSGPTARPTEGSRIDGRKILAQICGETGGRMFEAGRKASIEDLSAAIANELTARYLIQFTPDKQSAYGGFHRVALTANKKGYYAQAREGYYTGD